MKKLVCLLLCATLLCTALGVSAAETTALSRAEIPIAETSAGQLTRLGMLRGTENGPELERPVTRAEALTFVWRVTGAAFDDIGYPAPSFSDIEGHWAYDAIEKFYHAGYINGTSETTFEPDRTVSGREFVKILLTVMGYDAVTLDNAYALGKQAEVLTNNFSKSVVSQDMELLRSDAVRILAGALLGKTAQGAMLYQTLIDRGLYTRDDFEGVLWCATPAAKKPGFADKLNSRMPTDKNYMFSPLSIKMALAMLANGAEGQTRDEILAACGLEDLDEFNTYAKELIETYSQTDLFKLDIANSIWINRSRTTQSFSQPFQAKIAEFYRGEAKTVTNDTAVDAVNGWVSEKTYGRIPTIIDTSDFWAALVNAVYFKANWQNEFHKGATAEAIFTDRNGTAHSIDFMHRTGYMPCFVNDGLQIVELPYRNRMSHFSEDGAYLDTEVFEDLDVSMYLLMGDGKVSDPQALLEGTELGSQYVSLSVPKFEFEYSTALNGILKEMGVVTAFDTHNANFRPMFDTGNMWVTDTVHKTFIRVDEEGTEAAAVTGMGMGGSAKPPEPVAVTFDKPFTFAVRDNISGEILFLGEYAFCG